MTSIFKRTKRKTIKEKIAEQNKLLEKLYANAGRQSKTGSR
jgi:hypothetical protein